MELAFFLAMLPVAVIGFLNQIAIFRRLEHVFPDLWETLGKPSLKNNTVANGLRTAFEMVRFRPPFRTDSELRTRTLVQLLIIVVMFAIGLSAFLILE